MADPQGPAAAPPLHRVRLSPNGYRSGLFLAAGQGHALTLFVLPKLWGPGNQARVPYVQLSPVNTLTVVGFEGDIFVAPAEFGPLLSELSARIADEQQRRRERKRKEKKRAAQASTQANAPGAGPDVPAGTDERPATDDDTEDTDEEPGLGALLSISETKGTPTGGEASAPAPEHPLRSLLLLALRAGRSAAWETNAGAEAAEDDDTAHGESVRGSDKVAAEDPLLLLAQWRLVELMEAHSRDFRRGYIPVEEVAPVIRGRVTQRGLVQMGLRAGPGVECAHDEFTDTTPLFRVLVTALDRIASGDIAAQHGFGDWGVLDDVHGRAAQLRRQLAHLPSLPRPVAAAEATRLSRRPLPRQLRAWTPALSLARAILRDEAPAAAASEDGVVAQHWWLDTSELWAAILRQALGEQVKQAASDAGAPRKTPWADLGNTKQPDLILELEGGRCVVADAKYKRLANASLSAADQYQIFTYSHITWLDQPPTEAWILYPCAPEAYLPPRKPHARYPHAEARTEGFKLWIKPVPFPTRKQLDPPAWDAYINKAREAIKAP